VKLRGERAKAARSGNRWPWVGVGSGREWT
jgi:hypothetical protein